jgi:hypothetical protein
MTVGSSRSPPSCEALIRSSVNTSTDTEGPRVLHGAGLNGGEAWRAATSRDFGDGRRRGGCRLMSSHVGTCVPGTSGDGMGLGAERYSLPLASAVASYAPRPPDVQPAGEGAEGVRRPERSAAGDTEVVVASASWVS